MCIPLKMCILDCKHSSITDLKTCFSHIDLSFYCYNYYLLLLEGQAVCLTVHGICSLKNTPVLTTPLLLPKIFVMVVVKMDSTYHTDDNSNRFTFAQNCSRGVGFFTPVSGSLILSSPRPSQSSRSIYTLKSVDKADPHQLSQGSTSFPWMCHVSDIFVLYKSR